jgi:hypothetical protein
MNGPPVQGDRQTARADLRWLWVQSRAIAWGRGPRRPTNACEYGKNDVRRATAPESSPAESQVRCPGQPPPACFGDDWLLVSVGALRIGQALLGEDDERRACAGVVDDAGAVGGGGDEVANANVGAVDQATGTCLPRGNATTAPADRNYVPSGPRNEGVPARTSSSSSLAWWTCNGEPTAPGSSS